MPNRRPMAIACGFGSNIWNNSQSDPAALYDPAATLIDRYP